MLHALRLPLSLLAAAALLLAPSPAHAQIVGGLESDEHFGSALAYGDFNGDGFDDLAVGVPDEDIFFGSDRVASAGAVNVIYGTADGLDDEDNQLWRQGSAGIAGATEAFDLFGATLAVGDFNGDSYDDLAIGVPFEDVGAVGNAGAVNVIYGSTSGLQTAFNQIWTQDDLVLSDPEADDRFGSSLAAGDVDDDGYDDLVVGAPREDISTVESAGVVHLIFGADTGLSATGNRAWTRSTAGQGDVGTFDQFGWALAAGDFSGDGTDDFAVGINGYNAGGQDNAGGVLAFYGDGGSVDPGNILWSQATPDVAGIPELGDQFGYALAAGDFDSDGLMDLAIGVPFESTGSTQDSGAVNVLYGTPTGLNANGNQIWSQETSEVPGAPEADDRFGYALAAGDFGGDGDDDLGIGVYGEDVGSTENAGAVIVLTGGPGGLSTASARLWRQGDDGVLDTEEENDHFGAALAAGDFDGDGEAELAVGVPFEGVGGADEAGAVHVVSRPIGTGDDPAGQLWYQGATPVADEPGAPETSATLALHPAAPNPFRAQTTLGFELPEAGPVRLAVYDLLGRELAVLVDEARAAGAHEVVFEAADLPSGAYVVRLETAGAAMTQRIALAR